MLHKLEVSCRPVIQQAAMRRYGGNLPPACNSTSPGKFAAASEWKAGHATAWRHERSFPPRPHHRDRMDRACRRDAPCSDDLAAAGRRARSGAGDLEYLPYRRRDGTVLRDRQMHGWFAGHGYAAVRVDIRGSGDSDGLLADEYLPQEQADAVEVIAWLAAQPWCSGAVGMKGISWGGFNALQVAASGRPR